MEIIRIGDWHFEVYSHWQFIHIEPRFEVLSFYLHPEQMSITIFNITFSIESHPKY